MLKQTQSRRSGGGDWKRIKSSSHIIARCLIQLFLQFLECGDTPFSLSPVANRNQINAAPLLATYKQRLIKGSP